MTQFYHHEQQPTQLVEHSTVLTESKMPSLYSSSRHRTFISKHLTNRDDDDDDDDDPDSIYKEAFIIEIFQHWKAKALEHQHTINNSENITTSNDFTQTLEQKTSSVETSNMETIPNETSNIETIPNETSNIETIPNETSSNNNKAELSNINEPSVSTIAMKKRTTPLPISHTRRKESAKKSITTLSESLNPNLLAPHTKNKYGTTTTTKKSAKPTTIFIEPKKTQPSLSQRPYSVFSFEECAQMNRRTLLEKQNGISDDHSPTSISTTWTPTSYITSTRSYLHSQNSSHYDDETSSDESTHESLLIRNKKYTKKRTNNQEKYPLSNLSNLIIPTAIYITDPNGNSRTFDLNDDSMEEYFHSGRIIDKDFIPTNINVPYLKNMSTHSSSSTGAKVSSTEQIIHDKHALHSIGEEEEEGSIDKYNYDGNILSKKLDHMEASTQVRKTKSNVQTNDTNRNQHENNQIPLARRWSDSFVSDDDNEDILLPQRPRAKTSSATSIIKPPVTPAVKLSKTKYLLMKLHLTLSPQKNDNSNTSGITTNLPPQKRTVRRSSDKKRYQTR